MLRGISLFSAKTTSFPSDLENLITPVISPLENSSLSSIPLLDLVKLTLFQMQDLNRVNWDYCWPIVEEVGTKAVTSFFVSGIMPKEVNSSLIILIPKSQNSTSFNHFKPISLCNVVYKIISKILVAKLKPLLHNLISPHQSAFLQGRWIIENQVIVQEMMHNLKT